MWLRTMFMRILLRKLKLSKVIQQGKLAEQTSNLNKDEMVNMIGQGASHIFSSKDGELTDFDIDKLLRVERRRQPKSKPNWLNWERARSGTSTWILFKRRVATILKERISGTNRDKIGLHWIAPTKRERKAKYAETHISRKL